jgi:hypothetical protein
MPQIDLLAQVVPILDAGRLHPRSAALHVAVTERAAVPVEDPRPRRLRPSALTRLSMHAPTRTECVAADLSRKRRLQAAEALCVLLLKGRDVKGGEVDVLTCQRVALVLKEALQSLAVLVLLVLELPAGVDRLGSLPGAKKVASPVLLPLLGSAAAGRERGRAPQT